MTENFRQLESIPTVLPLLKRPAEMVGTRLKNFFTAEVVGTRTDFLKSFSVAHDTIRKKF
ncbi:MAG: hypothetical protein IKO05_04720 [Selenomonadaceae bacterium]|nr:hypothetical protein [Selenomonadaceae bacterium]